MAQAVSLEAEEMELRYRPVKLWLDNWTISKKFFSLWYEYYDTMYEVPRDRLEYHFQQRNYRRSVKAVFEAWADYTGEEDIDSNRPWVLHSYKRIMKARSRLVRYWFTKTKTYKLKMTEKAYEIPTIRVTPAMLFKQSSRCDELRSKLRQESSLRSKLRQFLIQLRKDRLKASAKAYLENINYHPKRQWQFKHEHCY